MEKVSCIYYTPGLGRMSGAFRAKYGVSKSGLKKFGNFLQNSSKLSDQ
jgi:hypothetical protein